MAFDINQFKAIVNQLKPIEPVSVADPKGQAIAISLNIIRFLLQLSVYVFLVTLLFSGLIYLFSLGNDSQLQTAKKSFLYSLIGFLIVALAYALLSLVVQQIGLIEAGVNLPEFTARVFRLSFVAAGVGFLFILLFAGTRYMFSLGNEDEAAAARRQIIHALIGLALVVSAFGIGSAIIKLLGFTNPG